MGKSKDAWASWPLSGFYQAAEAAAEIFDGRAVEREYVVFDTETTDRDRNVARLCEVAGARVEFPSGRVVERFAEVVNPRGPCSPSARAVHGLTDAQLKAARPASAVLPEFFAWVGARPLIAHNASYDRDVLRYDSKRNGVNYPALPLFCSLRIARAVLRKPADVRSHGLEALTVWAGVDPGRAHRAESDVASLVGVLTEILRRSGKPLEELHGEADRL